MNQLEKRSYVIYFSREEEVLGLLLQVQGTGCVLGPVLGPENSASEQNSGVGIYDDTLDSLENLVVAGHPALPAWWSLMCDLNVSPG